MTRSRANPTKAGSTSKVTEQKDVHARDIENGVRIRTFPCFSIRWPPDRQKGKWIGSNQGPTRVRPGSRMGFPHFPSLPRFPCSGCGTRKLMRNHRFLWKTAAGLGASIELVRKRCPRASFSYEINAARCYFPQKSVISHQLASSAPGTRITGPRRKTRKPRSGPGLDPGRTLARPYPFSLLAVRGPRSQHFPCFRCFSSG